MTALAGVSLRVEPARVVGLIGPNGAGKTTLLNAISGVAPLERGRITVGEVSVHGLPPQRIARAGVTRTYQNLRIFRSLSVAQNVRAGSFAAHRGLDDDAVHALLARAGITEPALERRAGGLPYGMQRRLEIARALAGSPHVVLLDEPAAGLNPSETQSLAETIRAVARAGTGVLLVEHDMELVASVCDTVVVVNFGTVIAQGTPAAVARDPRVIEAYLGTSRRDG